MATIYDVAATAGVSPKTVSRVMNGDGPVSDATRKAVIKAMAKLGYVPSSAARSMRSQRSRLVGLISGAISRAPEVASQAGLPDIHIVQGVQEALAENGLTLLVGDTGEESARVTELFATMGEHRVDGLIYVSECHQKVALPEAGAGRPLVLANCFDEAGTPSVLPDDEAGQHALTAGLIARGYRRIAYLTLPSDLWATRLRLQGYARALADAGIGYDRALVAPVECANTPCEVEFLRAEIDRLAALPSPPDVLCLGNDRLALPVYGLLRDRGLRLPGGIAVAGYDDHRMITETLFPQLTSVVLPYRAMGREAAAMLIALMRGETLPDATRPRLVGGPVVWRPSVNAQGPRVVPFTSRTTQWSAK